jgi:hypothetical protein
MRLIVVAAVVLVGAVGLAARSRPEPQIPDHFTNLKILPKDISRNDLVGVMRAFALNLGTRCEHCHVGEGNDLSKFDFASDAKPEKGTARKMLTMVTAINTELLKGVGDPAKPPVVTCYTCHRGALKPLAAPAGGGGAALTWP